MVLNVHSHTTTLGLLWSKGKRELDSSALEVLKAWYRNRQVNTTGTGPENSTGTGSLGVRRVCNLTLGKMHFREAYTPARISSGGWETGALVEGTLMSLITNALTRFNKTLGLPW